MGLKSKTEKVLEFLDKKYPDAGCSLHYKNPFELLVATILSSQCTDERVNKVTKELFKRYNTPEDFANADLEDLKELVKPTGFFNNKAKNIKNMSTAIIKDFNSKVPDTMDRLVKLSGVGRKTANVILGNFYESEGVVVDTHVKRITHRLGLTKNSDPEKIEKDLMNILPKDRWNIFSHQMIVFGREICSARKPECDICQLSEICDFYQKTI